MNPLADTTEALNTNDNEEPAVTSPFMLELVLHVQYDAVNSRGIERSLVEMLESIPGWAAGEGWMTGDTPAEVITWDSTVRIVDLDFQNPNRNAKAIKVTLQDAEGEDVGILLNQHLVLPRLPENEAALTIDQMRQALAHRWIDETFSVRMLFDALLGKASLPNFQDMSDQEIRNLWNGG